MNQFGHMNMQLSPMGPRQTPPLQHPGQLSQAGAMNQVSALPFILAIQLMGLLPLCFPYNKQTKINKILNIIPVVCRHFGSLFCSAAEDVSGLWSALVI